MVNNDPTMAFKEWRKTVREFRINQKSMEPYLPWQNRVELDVREVKRSSHQEVQEEVRFAKEALVFLG